jgi:hypothetical protein
MNKRVCLAIAGFAGLSSLWLPLNACWAQQPDAFRLDNPGLFHSSSPLWNTTPLPPAFGFNWTEPVTHDVLAPVISSGTTQTFNAAATSSRNLPERLSDLLPKLDYATGEVGFLYGRSTGKYGGELKEAYVIGDVGDDKFHISVGAAFEDSSFRFPKQVR